MQQLILRDAVKRKILAVPRIAKVQKLANLENDISYVHMYRRGYETLSFRSSKFRNYDPLTTTRVHTQFNYTANFERIMLSWLIPEVDM